MCDGSLGFTWLVDHFDENICQQCANELRCWACQAHTGGTGVRTRVSLPDGRIRCARCSRTAVDAQSDVGPVVRLVRPFLHSLGVRLPNRVRVELTPPDDLLDGSFRRIHGRTVFQRSPSPVVLGLRIVSGLPATQFGQVLAHEMGHAWLAGCPDPEGRSERAEEGLCELLASWWLRHRGGPLANHLLDSMAASPDPVYGEGYRLVLQATEGLSPHEVVGRIATGSLAIGAP